MTPRNALASSTPEPGARPALGDGLSCSQLLEEQPRCQQARGRFCLILAPRGQPRDSPAQGQARACPQPCSLQDLLLGSGRCRQVWFSWGKLRQEHELEHGQGPSSDFWVVGKPLRHSSPALTLLCVPHKGMGPPGPIPLLGSRLSVPSVPPEPLMWLSSAPWTHGSGAISPWDRPQLPQGWTPAHPSGWGPLLARAFNFFISNPHSRAGASRRFQLWLWLGMAFEAWLGGRRWILHSLPSPAWETTEDKEGSTAWEAPQPPAASRAPSEPQCAGILLLGAFDAPPKGTPRTPPLRPAAEK